MLVIIWKFSYISRYQMHTRSPVTVARTSPKNPLPSFQSFLFSQSLPVPEALLWPSVKDPDSSQSPFLAFFPSSVNEFLNKSRRQNAKRHKKERERVALNLSKPGPSYGSSQQAFDFEIADGRAQEGRPQTHLQLC